MTAGTPVDATVVEVPGAVPGLPRMAVTSPAGWSVLPLDGVLVALAEPPRAGIFRANLTVSWQRLAAGPSLDGIADQLLAQHRDAYPGLELISDAAGTLAGRQARAQEYAFDVPDVGSLFQVQAVLLTAPLCGVQDLLQLHATCGGDRAAALVGALHDAIVSFRLHADATP